MGGTNRQGNTAKGASSLTGGKPESEGRASRREHGSRMPEKASAARGGVRAVGVAVSKLAAPIVAKRGGGVLGRLKAEWAAIVGPDWAEAAWPIALGRDGVLKLRAASNAALELQHRAPLMIERVNLFLGRPVVTRLTLVQGPLPLAAAKGLPCLRPLGPNEEEALDKRLAGVADPNLRNALAKLGRAVSSQEN
jgi:hypothetical protein